MIFETHSTIFRNVCDLECIKMKMDGVCMIRDGSEIFCVIKSGVSIPAIFAPL